MKFFEPFESDCNGFAVIVTRVTNEFPELTLFQDNTTQMDQTPIVKIIYAFADNETKNNLKLVNKQFWQVHALEKYKNNYSQAQERRHRQLYCYEPCPNVDGFEVKIILIMKLFIKIIL